LSDSPQAPLVPSPKVPAPQKDRRGVEQGARIDNRSMSRARVDQAPHAADNEIASLQARTANALLMTTTVPSMLSSPQQSIQEVDRMPSTTVMVGGCDENKDSIRERGKEEAEEAAEASKKSQDDMSWFMEMSEMMQSPEVSDEDKVEAVIGGGSDSDSDDEPPAQVRAAYVPEMDAESARTRRQQAASASAYDSGLAGKENGGRNSTNNNINNNNTNKNDELNATAKNDAIGRSEVAGSVFSKPKGLRGRKNKKKKKYY